MGTVALVLLIAGGGFGILCTLWKRSQRKNGSKVTSIAVIPVKPWEDSVNIDSELEMEPELDQELESEQLSLGEEVISKESTGGYANSCYYRRTGNDLLTVMHKRGLLGEMQTCINLETNFKSKYLFPNVYLPLGNGETTEVDLIFLTLSEIYVIENKNYGGTVYGSQNSPNWKAYYEFPDGDKKVTRVYRFLNPILQNEPHVYALRRLFTMVPPEKIVPIVNFNNTCKFKVNTKSIVVNRDGLIRCIKARQRKMPQYFYEEELEQFSWILSYFCRADSDTKKKHIAYVNRRRFYQ